MPTSTTAAYNETLLGDVNIAQVFVNNQKSDSYTLFGFWVNGTELAAYTTKNIGLSTQPQSPFPYSRLAGTTVGAGSDIYLYHQINQTAIAEDMYNFDGGFFTTNYFDVATSLTLSSSGNEIMMIRRDVFGDSHKLRLFDDIQKHSQARTFAISIFYIQLLRPTAQELQLLLFPTIVEAVETVRDGKAYSPSTEQQTLLSKCSAISMSCRYAWMSGSNQ